MERQTEKLFNIVSRNKLNLASAIEVLRLCLCMSQKPQYKLIYSQRHGSKIGLAANINNIVDLYQCRHSLKVQHEGYNHTQLGLSDIPYLHTNNMHSTLTSVAEKNYQEDRKCSQSPLEKS